MRRRRGGVGEFVGRGAHRALLMGTQCADRREALHSSRQRCHRGGRDKEAGRGRKGERERGNGGLLFSLTVYQLSLASKQARDTLGPKH